jgi:small-conductance mechanosensitive channel
MKFIFFIFLFSTVLFASSDFVTQVKSFFDLSLFEFDKKPISLASVIKALLYVVAGFLLGLFYKRWVSKVTAKRENISMMSVRLISNLGYYAIIIIFTISAVTALGINLSSLSLIAGALSIGIGFGLQTVVSNLIAGIIIMFERTIRIGDVIEISDNLSGTVTDMRIRSTTVKTFDNVDIIVPNSSFIQNNVINLTLEDRIRRLHIPFGVAYGTEIDEVKTTILEALEKSELIYIRDDEDKKPDVRMTLLNESSVDLELIVWVNRAAKQKQISFNSDFLTLVYNALKSNNINIPFPQLDVHMKSE